MPALRDLQRRFAAALLADNPSLVPAEICGTKLSPAALLQIYRNNQGITKRDSLAAVFPITKQLVGSDFFALCSHHYRGRYPSCDGDIRCYGEHFPYFLGHFPAAQSLPYLSDIARLEWACHCVFRAATLTPASHAQLERLSHCSADDYKRLQFVLHPACRLLQSRWPILAIWQAHQDDSETLAKIDLQTTATYRLLVIQHNERLEIQALAKPEYTFLAALSQGWQNAIDKAQQQSSANDWVHCLQHRIRQGIIYPTLHNQRTLL